ncbi:ATP-binding protein [Streptomyces sp. NPDC051555]|uniref:ATP-binding protein n=1 Tax=Streptomyces sp. NPDC051555 TaxID=3365657 RepID=UPI0037A8ABA7
MKVRVYGLRLAADVGEGTGWVPLTHPSSGDRQAAADQAELADGLQEWAAKRETEGEEIRVLRLRRLFGLSDTELDVLLVLAARELEPSLDLAYQALPGGNRGPGTPAALAVEIAGAPAAAAHWLLHPHSVLRAAGLAVPVAGTEEDSGASFRAADRVVGYLLGRDEPAAALEPLIRVISDAPFIPPGLAEAVGEVRAAALAPSPLLYLRQSPHGCALETVLAALAGAGSPVVHLDLERVEDSETLPAVLTAARLEARLRGAALVAGPLDALGTLPDQEDSVGRSPVRASWMRALTAPAPADGPALPVILTGSAPIDPRTCTVPLHHIRVPDTSTEDRALVWDRELRGTPLAGQGARWADCRSAPLLTAGIITAACTSAALHARPLSATDITAALRALNPPALERLTRHITPDATFEDLVLAPAVRDQLEELTHRARYRDLVLRQWRLRPGNSRGHGTTALFSGVSGTGKTLAAEAIAHALGRDLYIVNLAGAIDKYIGETEKNLEKIFAHAEHVHGILLFDEADALFGKRSSVKDAHDRYANTQTSYLLQRLEAFDGLAIMTTNLAGNIDDAFTRRLDAIITFPIPDESQRLALWDTCLGPRLPRSPDLDLRPLAALALPGGTIRSIAVTAAYHTATHNTPLTTTTLLQAARTEYQKLGYPPTPLLNP